MKKIPLILLILSFIFVHSIAQTKSKPKKKVVKPIKTATPAKSVAPIKTPTLTPTPIPTPIPAPAQTIVLSEFEAEILAELNLFRRDPPAYNKYLEDFLNTHDGQYFKNGNGILLESVEGKKNVEEVIAILKETRPLVEFKLADGLIKATADHSQDMIKNNKTGHRGSNGSLPEDRVNIYGTALDGVNENISYGAKTARDVVLTMLIDDGVANRSHRKNLLNPNFKVVGLSVGETKAAGIHCVIVFASSFTDKNQR
jgi:uncharacterized protein YkwD